MMDPTTLNTLITAGAGLLGAAAGALAGTRLTIYRITQLEKKVEKHNNLVERMAEVEAECTRRHTECAGRFVGAKRDTKEAIDEHCLSCHQGAKARP